MNEPQVDIRPQPTAAERRAIEQALATLGLLAPAGPAATPVRRPPGGP